MEASKTEGMVTMDRALADLLEQGLITEEDALRYSRSTHTIRGRSRGLNTTGGYRQR